MAVNDIINLLQDRELSERLPTSYNIDVSKINDILIVISDELNELYQAIIDVEKTENIDFMFGKSIDYYGENFDEYRDGANDEDYKRRIRAMKLAIASIGDEDTIISRLASYFGYTNESIHVYKGGIRQIEIEYPEELDEEKVIEIVKEIKAAGIRFFVTKDLYWEDLTYEEMEKYTFEELERYVYERGDNRLWVNLQNF